MRSASRAAATRGAAVRLHALPASITVWRDGKHEAHEASVKKDKEKVLDEVWDDERVRSFLGKAPPAQSGVPLPGDGDYYVLRHAYQAMRAEDFRRFLGFYAAQGRDVHAKDGHGRTLAQAIAGHANAGPFVEALNAR